MNSLVGNEVFQSCMQAESKIKQYKWYEFNTDSWFHNEWVDLGILGINELNKEFGILAASDMAS